MEFDMTQLFGYSEIDITPVRPQYLAGYAGREEPHEGVADPLYVRVSALKDCHGRRLVLISFDLLGTPESMSDEIYARCLEKYGLSRNSVVINSVHTHCAPLVEEFYYAPEWTVDREYCRMVVDSAVEAVGRALADFAPARIRFGIGHMDMGINRRLPMNGDVYMAPNPDAYYLADVPVLQAIREGREDTVIYSMSCHPTTRGGQRISADFPGAAAANFNGRLQFLQGAAGSAKVRCLNDEGTRFVSGDDEWLDAAGKRIAAYLNEFMASDAMEDIELDLKGRILRVDLPVDEEKIYSEEDLQTFYKFNDGDNYNYVRLCVDTLRKQIADGTARMACEVELRGVKLADGVRFITVSAEITAELARIMMNAARRDGEKMFLLGYTGFRSDYLPVASMIPEGGYEGVWAHYLHLVCGLFRSDMDEFMAEAAKDLMAGV